MSKHVGIVALFLFASSIATGAYGQADPADGTPVANPPMIPENQRRPDPQSGSDVNVVTCPPGQFGRDAVGGLLVTPTGLKLFRCRHAGLRPGSKPFDPSSHPNLPVAIPKEDFGVALEKLSKGDDPCYRWLIGGTWRYVCY